MTQNYRIVLVNLLPNFVFKVHFILGFVCTSAHSKIIFDHLCEYSCYISWLI